ISARRRTPPGGRRGTPRRHKTNPRRTASRSRSAAKSRAFRLRPGARANRTDVQTGLRRLSWCHPTRLVERSHETLRVLRDAGLLKDDFAMRVQQRDQPRVYELDALRLLVIEAQSCRELAHVLCVSAHQCEASGVEPQLLPIAAKRFGGVSLRIDADQHELGDLSQPGGHL